MFLLNLQVEFELILDFIDMFYSGNNNTIINGLQLDMAPAIGSLGVKTILIQKNMRKNTRYSETGHERPLSL
jgi:hypothetical protein